MHKSATRTLGDEVQGQPMVLEGFGRQALPRAPGGSIFAGAGDSYAAALAAFYASKGRCTAIDPYALASDPEIADGRDVYFISASGRTSSNALAADRVKGHANRTTALTAVADSKLAALTESTIKLPMAYVSRRPGILSFSLSLMAVLKMVGDPSCDFRGAMREARKKPLSFCRGRGTTYFLGNSLAHPAAFYAAAKTYEIIGARAHAEQLEEFSHLELFSVGRTDIVNSFGFCDPSATAEKLSASLKGRGYEAHAVPVWGRTPAEQLFHAVFQIQLSVLKEARARELAAPAFLGARGALETSDAMIY